MFVAAAVAAVDVAEVGKGTVCRGRHSVELPSHLSTSHMYLVVTRSVYVLRQVSVANFSLHLHVAWAQTIEEGDPGPYVVRAELSRKGC